MRSQSIPELCSKYSKATSYKISNVSIKFEYEGENQLRCYITTPKLCLESTTSNHLAPYKKMTSNANTMKLYGRGNAWTEDYTETRVSSWEKIWNQKNPFSGFAVFTSSEDEFIGHVALDYDSDTPKHFAEISYIMKLENWGKGYGSEAVWSIVNTYSEELKKQKFLCNGEAYEGIYATARPDNLASASVLLKAGLEIEQKDFKPKQTQWGERLTFFKKLSDNETCNYITDINKSDAITNKVSL